MPDAKTLNNLRLSYDLNKNDDGSEDDEAIDMDQFKKDLEAFNGGENIIYKQSDVVGKANKQLKQI